MFRFPLILVFSLMMTAACFAQTDSSWTAPRFDSYQIYLKKPVKEIREMQNLKDCTPIKGRIAEERKIIMENYEPGNKVYLQLIYMDGTEEEFVRSPCYIDPVIL